jgi:hypothetical protein
MAGRSIEWLAPPCHAGIEEIGVAIEEPFSVLALEAICNTALSNVRELQSTHSSSALASDELLGAGDLVSAPQMVAVVAASAAGSTVGEEFGGLGGMAWVRRARVLEEEEEELLGVV